MKARLLGLLVCLFSLVGIANAANPTKIVFAWTYTPDANFPICTTTITTQCVNSFVLTEPTTSLTQSIPAVSGTSSYGFTLTSLPAPGTYTYTLVASAITSGGTVTSVPVTVQVQLLGQPASATSFTATPQ
jgi:hypothetical protein